MDKLKLIVITAIALIISFILGRYTSPTPEAKVEYKAKEVIKEVVKENKNIDVVKKKITKPDGTIEEETHIKDLSEINTNRDIKRQEEFKKEDTSLNKTLFFSVSNPAKFNKDLTYGVDYLDTKLIGRFGYGVGLGYNPTSNDVNVKVGITFSFK